MIVIAAEKNFEDKIKAFLKRNNIKFYKNWGGGYFTSSGRPDLDICVNGRTVVVELKAPNGKASDLQLRDLKQYDECGAFAILLYPDHYVLFKNFIHCLMEQDMVNAIYNYNILKRRWTEECEQRLSNY